MNSNNNIEVSMGSSSSHNGRTMRTYSARQKQNILLKQEKESSTINTNQFDLNDPAHRIAQLQQQLQAKDDLIQDLKVCLARNEKEIQEMQKKRVNWTPDEIATGFSHSYLGKSGYNFTIHKLGIPEPSIRTLQKWGEKINIVPGILEDCLTILKAMGEYFSEVERQVRMFTFFQLLVNLFRYVCLRRSR